MQRTVIYIIAIILVFGSCNRRPSYVVTESKMVDVLYDIQIAQAIYKSDYQFSEDSKKDILIAGVLKKHKVTQAQLDSSLLWYADNIESYNKVTDSVAARLKVKSEQQIALVAADEAKLNRVDAILPPFYYLTEVSPTLTLNIDSAKIKTVDLPNFNINFDIQGLSKNQEVEAALFYTYKDTLVKYIQPLSENKHYTFSKPQLPDSLLKTITGYVRMQNRIKVLPVNIIVYNISYSDSVSITSESLHTPNTSPIPTERSTPRRDVPPAVKVQEIQNPDLKPVDEDIPVIKRRSPMMRKSRKTESTK